MEDDFLARLRPLIGDEGISNMREAIVAAAKHQSLTVTADHVRLASAEIFYPLIIDGQPGSIQTSWKQTRLSQIIRKKQSI